MLLFILCLAVLSTSLSSPLSGEDLFEIKSEPVNDVIGHIRDRLALTNSVESEPLKNQKLPALHKKHIEEGVHHQLKPVYLHVESDFPKPAPLEEEQSDFPTPAPIPLEKVLNSSSETDIKESFMELEKEMGDTIQALMETVNMKEEMLKMQRAQGMELVEKSTKRPLEEKDLLRAMELGVKLDGPNGGYHRAIGGGYLAPHQYDPYNVNWHSYTDDGHMIQHEDFKQIV